MLYFFKIIIFAFYWKIDWKYMNIYKQIFVYVMYIHPIPTKCFILFASPLTPTLCLTAVFVINAEALFYVFNTNQNKFNIKPISLLIEGKVHCPYCSK